MHSHQIDPDTNIFTAVFSGPTSKEDLESALKICVNASTSDTRAVWDIRNLNVNFSFQEVLELVKHIHSVPLARGKMAFVVGSLGFVHSIIRLARQYPGNWRTEWNTFHSLEDARSWVADANCTPEGA